MRKLFFYSTIIMVTVAIVVSACNKDVDGRTDNAPALQPSNNDLNAGTWKPVLLTGPAEFAVAAPSATNTPTISHRSTK